MELTCYEYLWNEGGCLCLIFIFVGLMSLSVGESSFSCTELCRGWTGREKEIVEHYLVT